MAVITKVSGIERIVQALQRRAAKASRETNVSVGVGFSQSYAIHVHENLAAVHPVGQAKFLEQPARTMRNELLGTVRSLLLAGKTMSQALLVAGLKLQRAAQRLCPVDTGALKNSAFTRLYGPGE